MIEILNLLPNINLIIISIIVISLGGILRGFMGFGPALITIPMLSYLYTPTEALVIHIIMEIPSTLFLLPFAIKNSLKKQIFSMVTAMALAIPIGMYLIVSINPKLMRMIISVIVLILVGYLASGYQIKSKINRLTMILSGFMGGFIQGSAGMGGLPIVAILMARGDNEDTTRGNILFVCFAIVLFSIFSQLFYGLMNLQLFLLGILASPIYLVNTYFGSNYYELSGQKIYRVSALIFLSVIAIVTFIASIN